MKKTICLSALVITVAIFSCKKDTTTPSSNTNNSTAITLSSTPQFTGTINGTAYTMVNGSTYESSSGTGKQIGGTGNTQNSAEYETFINDGLTSNNNPSFAIWKGTVHMPLTDNEPDTATFDKFFKSGSYSYSINDSNGIEIDWVDPSGNIYTTSQGSGKQTGSVFTITAEKNIYNQFTGQTVEIVATFNCTLYSSTGQSITLTKGTYVGYFVND